MSFDSRAVSYSGEFERIAKLPRRRWTEEEAKALAEQMTPLVRAPGGTWSLLPVQAIYLRECWLQSRKGLGVFAPMGVGSGKTLSTLLGPRVTRAPRPLLIVPASLNNDGRKQEVCNYAKQFSFVPPPVVHTQALQGDDGLALLESHAPTDIWIDEFHLFKNPRSKRAAKLNKYLKAHPGTRVYALTGTIMKRSIKDFAHVLHWCLGVESPLPIVWHVLEEWAAALDEKLSMGFVSDPGVLLDWCKPGEVDELGPTDAARRAVGRRILETPGVIGYSLTKEHLPSTVVIEEIRLPETPKIVQAFELLRSKQELPDGTQLVEALEWTRHARTLPLGYWLRWKYPAPKEWLARRKAWGSFVREHLKGRHRLDSPDEVKKAFPGQAELKAWEEIRDSFKPETVAEWIDGNALSICARWLQEPGIAMTENTEFALALAQVAQVPYFGPGGLDASGRSIDLYAGRSAVASFKANKEGRNLQRWGRLLFPCPPTNGPDGQQSVGRIQRKGQTRDKLLVSVGIGCAEHLQNFWQMTKDSNASRNLSENTQIILDAEINVTRLGDEPTGPAWEKEWGRG